MSKSLATGAALTADTWRDFVERLRHDCVGDGVELHHTADAVFIVEKRVWQAVPEELSDILRVHTDGFDETILNFFLGLEPDQRAALSSAANGRFVALSSDEQAELVEKFHPNSTPYYAEERWEFVCQHFTRDAAAAFIKRKSHDYRDGLRVYVDASTYSWELNTIKAAILAGHIGFVPGAHRAAQAAQGG